MLISHDFPLLVLRSSRKAFRWKWACYRLVRWLPRPSWSTRNEVALQLHKRCHGAVRLLCDSDLQAKLPPCILKGCSGPLGDGFQRDFRRAGNYPFDLNVTTTKLISDVPDY